MDARLRPGKKKNEREVYEGIAACPHHRWDLPQNVAIGSHQPIGEDMADTTLWWLAAGILVAAELVTGTFYLLMLALGLAAGALAAHAGLGLTSQVVVAALLGGGAALGWHLWRRRHPFAAAAGANRDVNLDIGGTVHIEAWNTDGTASVRYRGAAWTAIAAPGQASGTTGAHRIIEVRGSQLLVEPSPS
jgi:membrane protein implicated in regulation of membrane protease activity